VVISAFYIIFAVFDSLPKCVSQHALNCREFVEKFVIAQIGCIDVAAVGMVRRVKLRQRAKFRGNRPNRCRDMEIFRFIMMAAAVILDF